MTPDWVKEIINGIIMDVKAMSCDNDHPELIQYIEFTFSSGKKLILVSQNGGMDENESILDYIEVTVK